jgi:hypothetical protein
MENLPKKGNKYETLEGEPVAELEAAANQLDTHATRLEREGSAVDISEETAERAEKKTSKIKSLLKAASMGLALVGAAETVSYGTSRYEITTEAGQDGKIEYEHEDPETTRIVKFLTGAAELAPEDRIHFYRQEVRNAQMQLMKITNPGEFGIEEQNAFEGKLPTDEQGLRELMGEIFTKIDKITGITPGDIKVRIDKAFALSIQSHISHNPALEKVVWNMLKKVGAPRVRWAAPQDNLWSQAHGSFAGPGRANYMSSDNTIYITPGSDNETLGKILFAESAHAQQFNEHPISSRARYIADTTKTLVRSIRGNKTMYEAQHEQYETPGSIEYEAHKEIEPRLIAEAMEDEKK